MPRRPPPSKPPRKPLPEEMAKDAIAHEEAVGSDKVRMTFRVILGRQQAEALAARAIREEKNIGALVTQILEAAVKHGMNRRVFLGMLRGGLLAAPLAAQAQQAGKIYRCHASSALGDGPFGRRVREGALCYLCAQNYDAPV